ncbi:type IV secretion system protein VirB10 [Pelomonas sp. Root1217]|nr:type IV secretion system protein VirB10 [Pelomonas sp. Root1217]
MNWAAPVEAGVGKNGALPGYGEFGAPDLAGRRLSRVSMKALGALLVVIAYMAVFVVLGIQRRLSGPDRVDAAEPRLARDKPTVAMSETRRLDFSGSPHAGSAATREQVPALVPATGELAEPIGFRRTRSTSPESGHPKVAPPEDASILLVTTRPGAAPAPGASLRRAAPAGSAEGAGAPEVDPDDSLGATSRNLQGYQRQLQGLLEQLTKSAALTSGQPGAAPAGAPLGGTAGAAPFGGPSAGGLFAGQLPGSVTARATAAMLGNRSLTLPKGAAFTCALKTRIISANSGLVGCQVQRNVFGDDGRVLLIERGSHLDGEYRIASVRPGTVRIPVLWTRIRTPLGVTVDIDSPATGPLGESGIDGHVDNRWGERIGAAMLLSLIDDSVKLVVQAQASSGHSDQGDTIVLPSTTANTSKLAEKVLDSTINIPPLVYRNQGGIVAIYVARDVDFSSVYDLRPTDGEARHEELQ